MNPPYRHARPSLRPLLCSCVAVLVLIVGCATTPPAPSPGPAGRPSYEVLGKRYYPLPSAADFVERGIASWYGSDFHGRPTSTGEIYNMYAHTAAHKTLPLHTYVEVTNQKNGKKTVVRINDRGPFVDGRIIDLSYTAASELGMAEEGLAPVQVVALGFARESWEGGRWVREYVKPPSYQIGDFAIQVGSFIQPDNAQRLYASLSGKYPGTSISTYDRGTQRFYRVWVGQYSRLEEAQAAAKNLQEQGFAQAFVIARD
ncbi:MAG TPA: septal ring lytic transglycosylase RlpA family protein [Syntrophobacteria bacterium]|nr:septal ring lytic transglycosylase RlpA family protein [Syntrophobacteria bacterium]